MIKKIRDWYNKRQEKKYRNNDAYLLWQYHTKLNTGIISDKILMFLKKGYPIYQTDNVLCKANKNQIKKFDGCILWNKDPELDKKIKQCKNDNINYVITDNFEDVKICLNKK